MPSWGGVRTHHVPSSEHRAHLESPAVPEELRRGAVNALFQRCLRSEAEHRLNREVLERVAEESGSAGDDARYYLKILDEVRGKPR